MQRVAIETPTPISAMVCKDGNFNVMDKAFTIACNAKTQLDSPWVGAREAAASPSVMPPIRES